MIGPSWRHPRIFHKPNKREVGDKYCFCHKLYLIVTRHRHSRPKLIVYIWNKVFQCNLKLGCIAFSHSHKFNVWLPTNIRFNNTLSSESIAFFRMVIIVKMTMYCIWNQFTTLMWRHVEHPTVGISFFHI